MSRFSAVVFLLCIIFALSLASRADVVLVNTFRASGPTWENYDSGLAWALFGPDNSRGPLYEAMQFTPSVTTNLKRIDLAASFLGGETNSLTLQLAVDNNNAPGAVLESWTLGPLGFFGDLNPPVNAISKLTPLLQAGVTYDVVAYAIGDEDAGWNLNNQGYNGNFLYTTDGSHWQTSNDLLGAYDVIGAPVPEPASALLLSTGMTLLAARLRRRTS